MSTPFHRWIRIALFNLAIVAAIGVILRYKIAYSLPFIDQKHLLHGHSHFAFGGWISQALMALLVQDLGRHSGTDMFRRYRFWLLANLFTAYGMLIAFPLQGYAPASIVLSTLSIFNAYGFSVRYWRDLHALPQKPSFLWYKAGLLFYAVSSLGAFALAYMMANRIVHQNGYLGAVYFFLHFQYNGWFFFAGMGLLYGHFQHRLPANTLRHIFWLFALACVPAYFLSALWMPIPNWVFASVAVAALLQVIGWGWLLKLLFDSRDKLFVKMPRLSQTLFLLAALALTVKLFLQLGSTIPSLSQLAFGFRPVVIGYLHLVLLGVISIFLLGYIFSHELFRIGKGVIWGCGLFIGGVVFNEIGLMLQGIAAMGYHSLPGINEYLLGMALIMFSGAALTGIFLKPGRGDQNA